MLALDSNCTVWCTCCVVFTLCALKLHIHPVDDCSFPFFSSFSFHFSCFSIVWVIFCMTMQGGPGSTPAQLKMVAGPHISSCKLRPGTSILHNCWEHGVCLLQCSSHAVARPACPAWESCSPLAGCGALLPSVPSLLLVLHSLV